MHGALMRRPDALTGCQEGSGEETELKAIVDLIEDYEALFLSLTYFIRLDTLLETNHIN
jgi:hypothetical protein